MLSSITVYNFTAKLVNVRINLTRCDAINPNKRHIETNHRQIAPQNEVAVQQNEERRFRGIVWLYFTIFIFYTNFSFVLLIFKSFLKIFVTERPVIRLTRLDITTITKIKIKELEKDAQKCTKNYETNGLKKHSHAWSEIIDLGSFPNFNFHLNSSNGQQISIKRI